MKTSLGWGNKAMLSQPCFGLPSFLSSAPAGYVVVVSQCKRSVTIYRHCGGGACKRSCITRCRRTAAKSLLSLLLFIFSFFSCLCNYGAKSGPSAVSFFSPSVSFTLFQFAVTFYFCAFHHLYATSQWFPLMHVCSLSSLLCTYTMKYDGI